MKFTINKFQIVNVLAKVQGLTGRRSNLAITENILIRSTNEGIHLTATDLETGFEGFYPASVEEEGAVSGERKKNYMKLYVNFHQKTFLCMKLTIDG